MISTSIARKLIVVTRPRDIRRQHAREAAEMLLQAITCQIDSVIQCGLGDWAEGPVLLGYYPHIPMMAVDPVHRYAHEAWKAGFRGPIIQGALWDKTGEELTFQDNRTETSVHDMEKRVRHLHKITTHTLTLDDAVGYLQFPIKSALLWLDTEGSENSIIAGASRTMPSVSAIICELKEEPKFPGWVTKAEMIEIFRGHGFELVKEVRQDGLFLRV